jgi:hypothetical protein
MVAMRTTLPSICYRKRVSSRLNVVICMALAACATRTPTARERALAQLPADAELVAAADGSTLADATFRRAIDAARAHTPAELGCVIDASLASEAIAAASAPSGTTIVIVSREEVTRCPALSRIDDDLYVATIGAGVLAKDRRESVLAAPAWARMRPYLEREPVVFAGAVGDHRVLAVAQPAPLDAWLTLEGGALDAVEASVARLARRWRTGTTPLSGRVHTTRVGGQLVVRAQTLEPDDLIAITSDVLAALDRPPPAGPPVFTCPPPGQFGIESCRHGTQLVVRSMWRALDAMTGGEVAVEVSGGDVAGVRLMSDAPAVLQKGDIVLGLDATRVTSRAQLTDLIRRAGKTAALAVRRDGKDVVVQLTQVE